MTLLKKDAEAKTKFRQWSCFTDWTHL